jgi:hypothetical protein
MVCSSPVDECYHHNNHEYAQQKQINKHCVREIMENTCLLPERITMSPRTGRSEAVAA